MPESTIAFSTSGTPCRKRLRLLLGAEAHHALDAGAVVPAAVEDHDLAGRRQVRDVALDVHLRLLALGRRRQRDDAEHARADALGDRLDRAALAGAVAAFEHDADLQSLVLAPTPAASRAPRAAFSAPSRIPWPTGPRQRLPSLPLLPSPPSLISAPSVSSPSLPSSPSRSPVAHCVSTPIGSGRVAPRREQLARVARDHQLLVGRDHPRGGTRLLAVLMRGPPGARSPRVELDAEPRGVAADALAHRRGVLADAGR